jgi:hypothetical protein
MTTREEPSKLEPKYVLQEAREAQKYHTGENKPYTAGVFADCIAVIEDLQAQLAGVAQQPASPVQTIPLPLWAAEDLLKWMRKTNDRRPALYPIGLENLVQALVSALPSTLHSPPLVRGSHNSGEADPSVMPDSGGGETVLPQAAIDNLTNHQEQCDMDGCMIKVSRQAMDEVLTYLALSSKNQGGSDA